MLLLLLSLLKSIYVLGMVIIRISVPGCMTGGWLRDMRSQQSLWRPRRLPRPCAACQLPGLRPQPLSFPGDKIHRRYVADPLTCESLKTLTGYATTGVFPAGARP